MQKLLIVYYYSENRTGKYFQVWFFPRFGKNKMAAFWACACKLSWTLLSSARVQPLFGGGKKGEFRDWTSPKLVCPWKWWVIAFVCDMAIMLAHDYRLAVIILTFKFIFLNACTFDSMFELHYIIRYNLIYKWFSYLLELFFFRFFFQCK